MACDKTGTRYFITKVNNLHSLKTCTQTGQWACRDRESPPHPRVVLSDASHSGRVVLIFSVNNQHGWHGYAEMFAPPAVDAAVHAQISTGEDGSLPGQAPSDEKTLDNHDHDTTPENKNNMWHYFPVRWKVSYVNDFGEQCLPYKMTEDMYLDVLDKQSVNKSRNWQEVSAEVGQRLCSMLDKFYATLCTQRDEKVQRSLVKQESPFYTEDEGESKGCEDVWRDIVHKVERDLGKVILACPFGSQRYNMSLATSDTDMFIVYQASTRDILGFHPPKQTIKNSERESCDYTIHEVFRYSELLLSGDARCVETLFLHDSTVVQSTPEWENLCQGRQLLLNRDCLNKYLRDAQGTRGTKLLHRWCTENPGVDVLTPKLCKLIYVIVRLLQNARDIVRQRELNVYREEDSEDRRVLMAIRNGDMSVETALNIIKSLEDEIATKESCVPDKSAEAETFVEQWLLRLRYGDMQDADMQNDGAATN